MNQMTTNYTVHEFDRCRHWIEAALEHSGGTHDFWDVIQAINLGHMQLWPCENGCLVTEILTYPKKKLINVFLGGGIIEDLVEMHEKIIAWGKSNGCCGALITGRKGWSREFKKYGWREKFVTISKDFDE